MLSVRPVITDASSIVFADEGEILASAGDPDLRYNQIIRPWKSRLALLYIERATIITDCELIFLTLVSAFSRGHALKGVKRLLKSWNADAQLLRMAARRAPLEAWPPPGSACVVDHYPRQFAA